MMSKILENQLLKAKIDLMTRSAFISTIALSARHVITDSIPTAAVCGTTIMYNPEFIAKQSISQLSGLMAHECWHLAFQHRGRRGDRDPIIWNCAADYIINNMLIKAGFEIPVGGLMNNKYDSEWSTDAVYDDLIDQTYDPKTGALMLDLVDGEDGDQDGIKLDSQLTNIIVRARTQAQISNGNAAGEIPGEILRIIDKLLNPRLPWQVLLNKFLDQRTNEEYSWARRNRRFQHEYLPSLHSYGLGHLTFAIDTSGSITDEELQIMLSEITGIQQVFRPEKMTIIDCDARIHQIHEVDQNTNILQLEFSGNGGTRFKPVLDYMKENPTQALVYFTDLYGEETFPDDIDYPILWICNSDHEPAPVGETIYVD